MGPVFPDCCPGGCTFFRVSISQSHSFFSQTEEYSEKEWANLNLISQDSTTWLCGSDKSLKLCEPKFSHLSNEDNPSIPDSKSYPEVQMRSEKIFYSVLYNAIGIAIFIISSIILIPFPGGR